MPLAEGEKLVTDIVCELMKSLHCRGREDNKQVDSQIE